MGDRFKRNFILFIYLLYLLYNGNFISKNTVLNLVFPRPLNHLRLFLFSLYRFRIGESYRLSCCRKPRPRDFSLRSNLDVFSLINLGLVTLNSFTQNIFPVDLDLDLDLTLLWYLYFARQWTARHRLYRMMVIRLRKTKFVVV